MFKGRIDLKKMAINSSKTPYSSWNEDKQNSDYRSNTTQNFAYVRQALAQERYLKNSNRVNPGPTRNTRANMADNSPQNPHVFGSEDMWGWQKWTEIKSKESSTLAPGLYEVGSAEDIPGNNYPGPSRVSGWAGCSSCKRRRI